MLGVFFAALGGSLSATGANVMAWSSEQKNKGREWSRAQEICFELACWVLNLTGIALFATSCAMGGAVATVMPIQTGANLLANMFWQMYLRIKFYTKEMRIGTCVLICAVAELGELGPKEPEHLDVEALISQPLAIFWIILLVVGTGVSLAACLTLFNEPKESVHKLISFTSFVSFTTVIGSSLSKCFGLVHGPLLFVLVGIYFIDGFVLMKFTVWANKYCDVSIFIPAQLSSQLVINMGTGFFVWGDGNYIDRPFSYMLVYVISILGVYLISPEVDVMGRALQQSRIRQTLLSNKVAVCDFGQGALELHEAWQKSSQVRALQAAEEQVQVECKEAFEKLLRVGTQTGVISPRELIGLSVRLLEPSGFGPSPQVVQWLEEDVAQYKAYGERDPEFRKRIRETLTPQDQTRLPALPNCSGLATDIDDCTTTASGTFGGNLGGNSTLSSGGTQ